RCQILLSFPSRRSSDLKPIAARIQYRLVFTPPPPPETVAPPPPPVAEQAPPPPPPAQAEPHAPVASSSTPDDEMFEAVAEVEARSEEHTSELQSRENLV